MSQVLAGCCCIQGDDGSGSCACGKAPLTAYVINYTARFKVRNTTTARPNECLTAIEMQQSLITGCHDLVLTGSIPITIAYEGGEDPYTCAGGRRRCDGFISFVPGAGLGPVVTNCLDGVDYYRVPGFGVASISLPQIRPIAPTPCNQESKEAYENLQNGLRYDITVVDAALGCPTPGYQNGHEMRIQFGWNTYLSLSGDVLTLGCFMTNLPVSDQGCFLPNLPYTPVLYTDQYALMTQQSPSMTNPRGVYTTTGPGCAGWPVAGFGNAVRLDSITATVT